jgi:trk system potassium uptake protein TrkH
MWESTLLRAIGYSFAGAGIALLIPLIYELCFGDDITPFMIPMIFCICVSLPLIMLFGSGKDLRPVDGLLTIVSIWGVVTLIAAVPFMLCGMNLIDAFFESISGFTTTGATVMEDLTKYPESLILWRSFTQWVGGIAIILIFVTLFPILGFGGRSVFRDEISAFGSKNFSAKMRDTAKEFCIIYGILSGIFLIACIIMGINLFESVCLTFSTISTGGFLPHQSDIGVGIYPVYIQLLVIVFMFLGGTNFYLHYQRIYRKKGAGYLKNTEFRSMLTLFVLVSLVIFGLTYGMADTDLLTHMKEVVFTVVSLGTTTSYMVTDINGWITLPAVLGILFLLTLIGGSSGSTSGGIKAGRSVAILKSLLSDVRKRIHPRAVSEVKLGNETLDDNRISAAHIMVLLFLITIAAGYLGLLMFEPSLDGDGALMVSLTSVSNSGFAGPHVMDGGFSEFSGPSKILLSLLMWLGRLEIGTAIIVFTPFFWREVRRGGRRLRRIERGRSL